MGKGKGRIMHPADFMPKFDQPHDPAAAGQRLLLTLQAYHARKKG